MTLPKQPERFKRRQERMRNLGVLASIPAGLILECTCTLSAYYGGDIRAGIKLIQGGIQCRVQMAYWELLMWFSDRMGWTKLVRLAPDVKFSIRHAGSCDKLNCQDVNCCERDMPQWFRRMI